MVKKLVKSKTAWLTLTAVAFFAGTAVLLISKPTMDDSAVLMLIEEEQPEERAVVSRTQIELMTKPTEIKVIEGEQTAEAIEEAVDEATEAKEGEEVATEEPKETEEVAEEKVADKAPAVAQTQVKQLVNIMAESLKEGSQQLEMLSGAMHNLNKRVLIHKKQIEILKSETQPDFGKIKDLTKVFLSQQLVVLDNRYQKGLVTPKEIDFISTFALETAKMPEVAAKLAILKEVTPTEGPATFAEVQLIADEASRMHPPRNSQKIDAPNYSEFVSFTDKAKAFFEHMRQSIQGMVSVRKHEAGDKTHPWLKAVYEARYAIARGRISVALTTLESAPLAADHRLNELRALVKLYQNQAKALQDAQQSFILGYKL